MTIKPVNTANLESILTRIWSGELEHNQDDFFCGTACCVAGWDVALNHPDDYENYLKYVKTVWAGSEAFLSPFDWATSNNNLNHSEAVLMFDAKATKYLQHTTLKAFKEGRRLSIQKWGIRMWDQDIQSDHYSSGMVQIATHCKEDSRALIEFLGDFDDSKIQVQVRLY